MASRRNPDKSKETAFEAVFFVLLALLCILVMVWLFSSNKIVWASLNPALLFGAMWKWVPTNITYETWNSLVSSATAFSVNPGAVDFSVWFSFMNKAFLPLSILLSSLYVGVLAWILLRKRVNVARKITPDMLLAHTMKQFTGIAPVLKIRKQIVDEKLPQWRTPVSPEEIFTGKVGNPSMIQTGSFDRQAALEFFTGITKSTGAPEHRLHSRMLGWQVVNLVVDKSKKVVFTDRLSNEGKVLMALWAAAAFGGDDGRKEYTKYCNLLNRSAYGSSLGLANLAVANPLFEKYRTHKDVLRLFAIHHWENTFLFSLLEIAQKKGRYTTADVLWLRPANRQMFASLNSCGSKTPHPEAASTFSQVGYERTCAAMERLPLVKGPDGALMHHIDVMRAVNGLEEDYNHWLISTDDNIKWWDDKNLWRRRDAAMTRVLLDSQKVALPPEPAGELSDFDREQAGERQKIEKKDVAVLDDEFSKMFGTK